MGAFNIPSKLFNPFQALQSPFNILQSPQELPSCKTTLKVKTLLAKMSEVNEMRNRIREKGVNACLNYLPNPRLPFPSLISLKKKTKKIPIASSRAWALGRVFIVGALREHLGSVRSLQNQGAQIFKRNHAPKIRSQMEA